MLPVPNDARVCQRCGTETYDTAARCARCGGRVTSAKMMRALGWLLVGLGTFLVVLMGAITIYVANVVYHSNDPGATTTFTGGAEMEFFMFGLFGLVLVFGVACVASGAWQARYAKPNRKLMFLVLGLGVLFFVIGRVVRLMNH